MAKIERRIIKTVSIAKEGNFEKTCLNECEDGEWQDNRLERMDKIYRLKSGGDIPGELNKGSYFRTFNPRSYSSHVGG
jgi:hypothetical protein